MSISIETMERESGKILLVFFSINPDLEEEFFRSNDCSFSAVVVDVLKRWSLRRPSLWRCRVDCDTNAHNHTDIHFTISRIEIEYYTRENMFCLFVCSQDLAQKICRIFYAISSMVLNEPVYLLNLLMSLLVVVAVLYFRICCLRNLFSCGK